MSKQPAPPEQGDLLEIAFHPAPDGLHVMMLVRTGASLFQVMVPANIVDAVATSIRRARNDLPKVVPACVMPGGPLRIVPPNGS